MFDFSMGEFKLVAASVVYAQREAKRQRQEGSPSTRAYITERTEGGWQGLTADGRRVSDALSFDTIDWTGQWVTIEWTESGAIIAGGAAFDGAPPDPVVDGDGG